MKTLQTAVMVTVMAVSAIFLSGCSDDLASIWTERATIGYTSAAHKDLISLPEPQQKIVVAVYKFRDQTGQYKTSAQATTFSTAVTQGATSMLNKALEDSGWFTPIERESLPNLLNERKIIRSTRLQFQAETGQEFPALPGLLYAGVLLEGGIISYDTNLLTGGFGVKYFGVGGSGDVRSDRITIYLRLVSTKSGQVLKTVSTSKAVLSRQVNFGIYRFVSVKRLLEVETGLSTNEPPSMCVLEAIEKAVSDLIIEGIQDGLWGLKNPEDINSPIIQNYLKEKRGIEKALTFDKEGNLVEVEDVKVEDVKVEDVKVEDVDKPKPPVLLRTFLPETKPDKETGKPEPEDVEKPEDVEQP